MLRLSKEEKRSYHKMETAFSKKTLASCVNVTAKDFQLMIRIESADRNGICQCVTCHNRIHYKHGHAGHFITRGKWGTLLEESNVHFQCVHCNKFLSGNVREYTAFIEKKYGCEKVMELKRMAAVGRQFTKQELLELRIRYKRRINKARKRLNGA